MPTRPPAAPSPSSRARSFNFAAASAKKSRAEQTRWSPTNVGFQGPRLFPSFTVENWSGAWKVRRHFEEQTELRKARGLPVY